MIRGIGEETSSTYSQTLNRMLVFKSTALCYNYNYSYLTVHDCFDILTEIIIMVAIRIIILVYSYFFMISINYNTIIQSSTALIECLTILLEHPC